MHFRPEGVCSGSIDIRLEGDIVREIRFTGGCSGNLQGIAALAEGMKVEEVIARLKGIRCGSKTTSCPAQLAKALQEMKNETANEE